MDILKKALSGKGPVVTARDVSLGLEHPFTLWCNNFGPSERKDGPSKFQELLFEKGSNHEQNVVSSIGEHVSVEYVDLEDGFAQVLELMSSGVERICNAPLFWLPDGMKGVADVLEKVDGESIFGDYHYVVKR